MCRGEAWMRDASERWFFRRLQPLHSSANFSGKWTKRGGVKEKKAWMFACLVLHSAFASPNSCRGFREEGGTAEDRRRGLTASLFSRSSLCLFDCFLRAQEIIQRGASFVGSPFRRRTTAAKGRREGRDKRTRVLNDCSDVLDHSSNAQPFRRRTSAADGQREGRSERKKALNARLFGSSVLPLQTISLCIDEFLLRRTEEGRREGENARFVCWPNRMFLAITASNTYHKPFHKHGLLLAEKDRGEQKEKTRFKC